MGRSWAAAIFLLWKQATGYVCGVSAMYLWGFLETGNSCDFLLVFLLMTSWIEFGLSAKFSFRTPHIS